jgi:hypothetical protein
LGGSGWKNCLWLGQTWNSSSHSSLHLKMPRTRWSDLGMLLGWGMADFCVYVCVCMCVCECVCV